MFAIGHFATFSQTPDFQVSLMNLRRIAIN